MMEIDPEVRLLMDELVADPDSALLRPPNRPLRELWRLHEPPLSSSTPSLANMEKHLLQRKREEVAELLFQASKLALSDAPYHWGAPVNLDNWEVRLEASRSEELADESKTLESSLGANGQGIRGTELAVASLRVVPNDRARIQYALSLQHEGSSPMALRVLKDVLCGRPSARDKSNAMANCGMILGRTGALERAREWYRASALAPESRAYCKLNWLLFAIRSGHGNEAGHANQVIDDTVDPHSSEIVEFLDQLRADVRAGHWLPGRSSTEVASALHETAGETARRLLDELP